MTRLVALALVLAACGSETNDGYPITPGGGGGTGSQFTPDAPYAGDAGTTITGRVCLLLSTPQSLVSCAATGAGSFMVSLGSQTAMTADDGSFTIMRPAVTTGLVWRVSGTGLVPSAMPFGTTTTLPAFTTTEYQTMLAPTNAPIADGDGALMVRITRGGTPVQNATVAMQPVPVSGIFYDGPSDDQWQLDATGAFGVAWAPSIAVGTASATIMAGSTPTTVGALPVYANTITFAFADIP